MRTRKITPNKSVSILHLLLVTGIQLFLMSFLAGDARAETALTPKPLPPQGPLLAHSPDFSQWVVTISSPEDTAQNPGAPKSTPVRDTRPRMITTTKTSEIIHEEFINGLGTKFDEWHVGSTLYTKEPDSTLWGEVDGGKDNGSTRNNDQLPASGFRDLDWITKDTYIATIKCLGHECLVFSMSSTLSSTIDIDRIESWDTYALIDAASRLPVQVKASGMTRTYQFKDRPSQKLTLPSDLAEQLRKGREAFQRLNQPMPRPY